MRGRGPWTPQPPLVGRGGKAEHSLRCQRGRAQHRTEKWVLSQSLRQGRGGWPSASNTPPTSPPGSRALPVPRIPGAWPVRTPTRKTEAVRPPTGHSQAGSFRLRGAGARARPSLRQSPLPPRLPGKSRVPPTAGLSLTQRGAQPDSSGCGGGHPAASPAPLPTPSPGPCAPGTPRPRGPRGAGSRVRRRVPGAPAGLKAPRAAPSPSDPATRPGPPTSSSAPTELQLTGAARRRPAETRGFPGARARDSGVTSARRHSQSARARPQPPERGPPLGSLPGAGRAAAASRGPGVSSPRASPRRSPRRRRLPHDVPWKGHLGGDLHKHLVPPQTAVVAQSLSPPRAAPPRASSLPATASSSSSRPCVPASPPVAEGLPHGRVPSAVPALAARGRRRGRPGARAAPPAPRPAPSSRAAGSGRCAAASARPSPEARPPPPPLRPLRCVPSLPPFLPGGAEPKGVRVGARAGGRRGGRGGAGSCEWGSWPRRWRGLPAGCGPRGRCGGAVPEGAAR